MSHAAIGAMEARAFGWKIPVADRAAWIASLVGAGAAASELRRSGDPAWLLPEERLALQAPSLKRLHEFAAGRACARHALCQLGLPPIALPADADRCPRWPTGAVGSITHTRGLCAAVAAPRSRFSALGLDAEVVADVTPDVQTYICTSAETRWLASLPGCQRTRAAALIFSAKEAFYKCQFTLSRQWLEFQEVVVESPGSDFAAGRFTVYPLVAVEGLSPRARWQGCFRYLDGWVVAAVAMPAQRPGWSLH